MFKRIVCGVFLAAAFNAPPAHAGMYLTGNDLFADCSVPKDNAVYFSRTERCTGFITGVVDATEGLRSLQSKPYCVPPEVTLGQLNEVVLGYLQANPANRSLAASALVIAAVSGAYGCVALIG
ncbi:MAG: hypothetical protein JWL91_1545 [Sphingomonas bacterium]|jgi:hypothetical protein|nr:Rap1a/Tai family immunity protein [Sphingomonas bacterium]MDB5689669.1 hypothetical protein [Sphingomonas bacterium]